MTEAKKAPGQATAGMIHDEAFRARIAAESVLETMTKPKDDQPDPLAELMATLQTIVQGQAVILKRLDVIERRLSLQQPASATR